MSTVYFDPTALGIFCAEDSHFNTWHITYRASEHSEEGVFVAFVAGVAKLRLELGRQLAGICWFLWPIFVLMVALLALPAASTNLTAKWAAEVWRLHNAANLIKGALMRRVQARRALMALLVAREHGLPVVPVVLKVKAQERKVY